MQEVLNIKKRLCKKILHLCLHGKTNELVPPYGIDSDTGGQTKYFTDLAQSAAYFGRSEKISFEFLTRYYGATDSKKLFNTITFGPPHFLEKSQILKHLNEAHHSIKKIFSHDLFNFQYITHAHYYDAGILALKLYDSDQIPFFYTPHSTSTLHFSEVTTDKISARQQVEIELIEKSLYVFVSSELEKKNLVKITRPDFSDKIFVNPPGMDSAVTQNANLRFEHYELIANFIYQQKFCITAVRPTKAENALRQLNLPEMLGIKKIIITGTEPPKIVHNDILILPAMPHQKLLILLNHIKNLNCCALNLNQFEPFGLFILEAALAGLNIVCTENTGALEYLHKSQYFVYSYNQPSSLADSINKALVKNTSIKSSVKNIHKLTWKNHWGSYLNVIG